MFSGTSRYRIILWSVIAITVVFCESYLLAADNANDGANSTLRPVQISDFPDASTSTSTHTLMSRPDGVAQNTSPQTPLPHISNKAAKDSKTNSTGVILRILLTLTCLVGGLILLNRWIRHRFPSTVVPRLPDGLFEVLGRSTLTARQSVLLIRFGSKLVLLAITPSGPVPLVETDDPGETDEIFRRLGRSNPITYSPQNSQTIPNRPSQNPTQFREVYQTTLQRMRRGETGEMRSDQTSGGNPEHQPGGTR